MWALDSDQTRVIEFSGRGLLVTGPPGSGKTSVLVRRAERLLTRGVPAQSILILSAEGSGRAALRAMLGRAPGLTVHTPSTYARLCIEQAGAAPRILTRFQEFMMLQRTLACGPHLEPPWTLGHGVGVIQVVQDGLDALRRGEKTGAPGSALSALDRFMNGRFRDSGCLPYTAMVGEALRLAASNESPPGGTYTQLLVDGFENMSPVERELVRLLCRRISYTVFSADAREEDLPGLSERCSLSTVHRYLDAGGPQWTYWRFTDAAEEAAGVAAAIARLIRDGTDPRQIMVLYRDYPSMGGDLETALRYSGIPCEVQGGRPLVRGTAARLVAHYFESLAEPNDDDALLRWLTSSLVGLDLMALGRLRRGARNSGMPFEQFVREKGALWPGIDRLPGLLQGRTSDLDCAEPRPLLSVATDLLKRTGAMDRLLKDGVLTGSRGDEQLYQLAQYLRLIQEFDAGFAPPPDGRVSGAARAFLEASAAFWGENAARYRDLPAVRLMGVHQARGLEADVVFLCGVALGNFPRSAQETIPHEVLGLRPAPGARSLQEREEALFEAGVTRARRILCITFAGRYGRVDSEPSPLATARFGEPKAFVWPDDEAPLPLSEPEPPLSENAPQAGRALSHSAIRDFLTCPRRYFYGHVLRVQGDEAQAASLGNVVHDTLSAFHKRFPGLEAVDPAAARETVEELLDESMSLYGADLGPSLVAAGIREAARELLAVYLRDMAFPLCQGREAAALESEFELELHGRRIRGRIDRVDRLMDGSLELIDYKTSPHDKSAALGLKRQFLNVDDKPDFRPADFQLPLYYFALSGKGRVSRLSYYQLAGGNVRTFEVNPESDSRSQPREPLITGGDLTQIRSLLAGVLDEIESGHYPGRPRTAQDCKFCPYSWACTPDCEEPADEGDAL